MNLTRRNLLAAPLAASALRIAPADFRKRLEGPICSAPTVYRKDFGLDLEGFRRILDTGAKARCKAFTLTAGNNQYERLTYDEIRRLTRTFVEGVAGRGLAIAATGNWWTGQAVDYARYAASLGADAVQVMLPASGDPELLYAHFARVAEAGLPVVIHGQVPIPTLEPGSHDLRSRPQSQSGPARCTADIPGTAAAHVIVTPPVKPLPTSLGWPSRHLSRGGPPACPLCQNRRRSDRVICLGSNRFRPMLP